MMRGTVRGICYLLIGILIICGDIIAIVMMLSTTHVSLNFILQGLLIAISILEIMIGIMAINFGINRLRPRVFISQ